MKKILVALLPALLSTTPLYPKPLSTSRAQDSQEERYFKEKVEEIKKELEKEKELKNEQLPLLRKRLAEAQSKNNAQLAREIKKNIDQLEQEIDSLQSQMRTNIKEVKNKETDTDILSKEIKELINEAVEEYDYGVKDTIEDCIKEDIATKSLLKSKRLNLSQRSLLNDLLTKLSAQLADLLIYEHTKFKDTQEISLEIWQQRRAQALTMVPTDKNYDQKYQELLNAISYTQGEIAKLLNIQKEIFEKEFDVYSSGQQCELELFSKFNKP